jgi:hypothetical protein
MPRPHTVIQTQARYASLAHWRPGSAEAQEAGREFWFAKALSDLQDSVARSPLPFTKEQRARITELMVSA